VVWGDPYTEGSQTAKSGTDEQERYKRLSSEDKQAHHCNVRRIKASFGSRYRRHWMKGKALTRGGLADHELIGEKSAEAIVANRNEPSIEMMEVSRGSEGLNVRLFQMLQGGIYQPCIRRNRERRKVNEND